MRILRSLPAAAEGPVALTIGNFDGVHLGHQAMLARVCESAASDSLPACAMTFEPHPREFFAPDRAPARLTSLREKLELLAQAGLDRAYVLRFDYALAQIPAEEFVDRILVRGLAVKRLIVGDDFRFGARRAGDFALLKARAEAGQYLVEATPTVTREGLRVSSTAVREALAADDLMRARTLLGRPYSMSGRVTRGAGLGRKLGCPTANVKVKRNRVAMTGIFAVEVHGVAEKPVSAVASLGTRPTVVANGEPLLETYILDFAGDLYGKHLRIDFLHKFRDEKKFADLATLEREIARDVESARAYFARRERAARSA